MRFYNTLILHYDTRGLSAPPALAPPTTRDGDAIAYLGPLGELAAAARSALPADVYRSASAQVRSWPRLRNWLAADCLARPGVRGEHVRTAVRSGVFLTRG